MTHDNKDRGSSSFLLRVRISAAFFGDGLTVIRGGKEEALK